MKYPLTLHERPPLGLTDFIYASHLTVFAGGFSLFAGVVLGNLAVFPGPFNQALTVLGALILWSVIFSRGLHARLSFRSVGLTALGLGALLLHLLVLLPNSELASIQLAAYVRFVGLVVPIVWATYLVGAAGLVRPVLMGALLASTLSTPFVFLAPQLINEDHVAVGRLFMLGSALSLVFLRRSRVAGVALFIVHILAAFASGSRGAVIGAVLGPLIAIVISTNDLRTTFRVIVVGAGATFAYLSGYLQLVVRFVLIDLLGFSESGVVGRQSRLFEPASLASDQSSVSRLDLGWGPAIERFNERPVTGFGLGASAGPSTEPWFAPHNVWAEGLVSFGLFGFLAVGIFTLVGIWTAMQLGRSQEFMGLAAGILAWMVSIQFSGTLVINRTAYVVVALGLGMLAFAREERLRNWRNGSRVNGQS